MEMISKNNGINNEIKTTESLIHRHNETIKRLGNTHVTEFNTAQIAKLTDVIENLKNKIYILTETPDEFVPAAREKKENTKRNRGVVKQPYKRVNLPYVPREYSGCSEKFMQREADRYFKILETIPSFITQNLKNMPCNKGYIWRGVYCYGGKKADSETMTTMFEKCKGGVLRIHETTKYEKRIYEKVGSDRKKLISTIKRTFKP